MRHEIVTFAALTMLALPAHAGSLSRTTESLPNLGAPPQGTAQWIANAMSMNGLPMTLKVFESRLAPDAVLSHYESTMKANGAHEFRRMNKAPWQVLTLKTPDHLITVQARAVAHGSEGTILVSPALESTSLRTRTDFPRPASTRIVNIQRYDDDGVQSEHISLSSNRATFTELQDFSQLLISEGWTVVDTRPTRDVQRGFVLELQRQAEHALLVIVPNAAQPSTTAITITWRK
jgi:hypothetical protein